MVKKDTKRRRKKRQSSPPDLLNLPAGVNSPDPVEGNPFPEDNPRHREWQDATRLAEQEAKQLNVGFRKLVSESPSGAGVFEARRLAYVLRRFDIWARRGMQVVWSDAEVKAFDRWLVTHAEAWLQCTKPILATGWFDELRSELIHRIEFWGAEARRYLAEQKAQARESPAAFPALPFAESEPSRVGRERPRRSRGRPPDRSLALRYGIICEVVARTGVTGEDYAKALKARGLETPRPWQKNDACPKDYLLAWNHGDLKKRWIFRHRISNERYKATHQKLYLNHQKSSNH